MQYEIQTLSTNTRNLQMNEDSLEFQWCNMTNTFSNNLNLQADSLLFVAVLLLLQPIQIEVIDPVFQIGGLREKL